MVYIRRMIWFIASRLALLCALLGMLVCGFFMCLDLGNVYIVLDEGLEKRVEVILTREDAPELNNYFHGSFLSADPALTAAFDGSSPYVDYNITDFEHELTIESLWAWPWDDYATCTVVERVPSITGTVLSSRKNSADPMVPAWQGRRYDITLMKSEGKWKIVGMQEKSVIIEPTPTPTPTPSPSPTPTPAPAATPEA